MRKGFIVGRLFFRIGPKYRRFGDVGIDAVGQKQGNTPVRGAEWASSEPQVVSIYKSDRLDPAEEKRGASG